MSMNLEDLIEKGINAAVNCRTADGLSPDPIKVDKIKQILVDDITKGFQAVQEAIKPKMDTDKRAFLTAYLLDSRRGGIETYQGVLIEDAIKAYIEILDLSKL